MKTHIQQLIQKGKLRKAIDALADVTQNFDEHSTAILLSSRLSRLEKQQMQDTISLSDANVEQNKISAAALSLLDLIEEEVWKIYQEKSSDDKNAQKTNQVNVTGDNNIVITDANSSNIHINRN